MMPSCAPSVLSSSTLPRAALAEGEVVAGDDARRADLPASSPATNSSALVVAQLLVELEHQHRVGAGIGEQLPRAGRAWSGGTAARPA